MQYMEKKMENLRNRTDVKTFKQRTGPSKMGIKTKLHVKKLFDNDLVAIHKSKVTFNKPAYVGMSIVDLSKV